jgi:hypothetical protein
VTALIDDSGELVYSERKQVDRYDSFLPSVVVDPVRDLVTEPLPPEGPEATVVVQEYGCLD